MKTILQVVNPKPTFNKCGLWALLIGLYLAGVEHIDTLFDAILGWMQKDCARFLLIRRNDEVTGQMYLEPSYKMFTFPDGTYLTMGQIMIGRQEGTGGNAIEQEDFFKQDEGKTLQLFHRIAEVFRITIRVYEIERMWEDGDGLLLAEVDEIPRCQIGDGKVATIRIGRKTRGAHFYTLLDVGSIDRIVYEVTASLEDRWIKTYDDYLKSFEDYRDPEPDNQEQIKSDRELALALQEKGE